MKNHESLLMIFSPERAWNYFVETFYQPETVLTIVKDNINAKPELVHITDEWLTTVLYGLAKPIFVDRQWRYETQLQWSDRSPVFALREALLQSLATVAMDADLRVLGKRELGNWTVQEWEIAKLSAQTLGIFVSQQILPPQQYVPIDFPSS